MPRNQRLAKAQQLLKDAMKMRDAQKEYFSEFGREKYNRMLELQNNFEREFAKWYEYIYEVKGNGTNYTL